MNTQNPAAIINTIIPTEVIVQGIINDYSNSSDPAHKVIASLMGSMMQIITHMNNELKNQENNNAQLKGEIERLNMTINNPVDSKTHIG